ncbi:hypothetical protein GM182_06915 [bacterium 3DAC]|nr:hypothetical protein GM182_06915 [bacterium 3DAC]
MAVEWVAAEALAAVVVWAVAEEDLEVAEVAGNFCVFATSPSENAKLFKGFCKVPFIGFVEGDEIVWIENPFVEDSGVASIFLKFLLDKGITEIVSGDAPGAGVFPILERAGITAYKYDGTVKDAIDAYRNGKLVPVKDGFPKGDCR